MHAVMFEVLPSDSGYQRYLDLAAALRPRLEAIDGFVSIERFRHVKREGWLLSLSLWRDESALVHWRKHGEHHAAQAEGRQQVFRDYRIRVADMSAPLGEGKALVGLADAEGAPVAGTVYESLSAPDKRIVLCDFDMPEQARTWRQTAGADALCGAVLRDYGMFDRKQAPQQFPAVLQGTRP